MRKEFGKWLMDIAKYMVTALVLSSAFNEMRTWWTYVVVILIVLIVLGLGLFLVREKKEGI
jgi:uncharacterized membrane protein